KSIRKKFAQEIGFLPPVIHIRDNLERRPNASRIELKGVEIGAGEVCPGQWLAISGIGGLGHVAVQYARAMGLHVAAIDISPDKLALARQLGAHLTIDASIDDPATVIQKEIGGAHGVLVTAVSRSAFAQAL
ncbi:zinc-binding dehydrogenase, partial [Burkholderia cenocepacia]|uniref:zinc-binding dehydrogenase n=1 Tax=Burkholderia cenocepacia TaxID=95486 RepID=UPI0024B775AF